MSLDIISRKTKISKLQSFIKNKISKTNLIDLPKKESNTNTNNQIEFTNN